MPFHPVSLRVILILSSHLRLGVQISLFLRFFHQFLRIFLFFHICVTRPINLILLDLFT